MITVNFMFESPTEFVEVLKSLQAGSGAAKVAEPFLLHREPTAEERAPEEPAPKAEEPAPKAEERAPKEPAPKAEEQAAEEPAPKAEEQAASMPTTQDVREAMKAVRDLLEYGNPAAGETKGPNETANEEIHRNLTKAFKESANRIGGCKPSELPAELRQQFIDEIKSYHVDINENRIIITPF